MDAKMLLSKLKISPDPKYDQYFVTTKLAAYISELAGITDKDYVLEIGPGLGAITAELAKKARQVIAIEIDKRFRQELSRLPKNVTVYYGNAGMYLQNTKFLKSVNTPTKVVANIPYSQAQNLLLVFTKNWYKGDLYWIAPLSFVDKVNKDPLLGSYFNAQVLESLGKDVFYPEPDSSSAIIKFVRIADPKFPEDFPIYFNRFMQARLGWKTKNALRECLIVGLLKLANAKTSKKEVKNAIAGFGVSGSDLEKQVGELSKDCYYLLLEKSTGWFTNC